METKNEEFKREVVEVEIKEDIGIRISEAKDIYSIVNSLTINNNQEYINSGELLKKVKTASKSLDDNRKEITRPIDEVKKRVMDFFKEPVTILSSAETVLKTAMLHYQQAQEIMRREAEKKAIARAQAEESRRRIAIEERARKAEEKAAEIANESAEKAKALREKAEALREKAEDVYVPIVVTAKKVEKVHGIATKKVWKATILDLKAVPMDIYINDEKVRAAILSILNKLATATKGSMPINGVEFFKEESISAGRG